MAIARVVAHKPDFGERIRMASSSSSFPSHPRSYYASSPSPTSSTSSADEQPQPPRRLTLTIPPPRLKISIKPLKQPPVPLEDAAGPSTSAAAAPKLPTKIKLKAPKPKPPTPAPLFDSPVAGPSVSPLPPPPVERPKPPPRPAKLKPLKEVLARLIAQIKRKDDYAFFLQPVDASQVPGYSDVVKNPMDFGTMTTKVEKGRYRSLDEFMADFRLVISNAQAFNPPDSLYHTEAARIEHYGLEQIAKASATVIEFETDWTIDIVADTEAGRDAMDVDDVNAANGEGENAVANERKRSPSVSSSIQGPAVAPSTERSRRSRKKVPVVTESWEPGGHLPGYSDGLGAFPPGSEMANVMMQLKHRGKLFRNKKEKMRFERSGIPYHPDGSLAYSLMERPFTMLNRLVPESMSLPNVTPLIITQSTLPEPSEETASQPPEDRGQDRVLLCGPVALPVDKISSFVDEMTSREESSTFSLTTSKLSSQKRRKYWTITRASASRSRPRDADDADDPPFKRVKVPEPTDYGSFAALLGEMAAEKNIPATRFDEWFGTNEKQAEFTRRGLQVPPGLDSVPSKAAVSEYENEDIMSLDAEAYVRDVVYGGVDGLAYIRSLAHFCGFGRDSTVKPEEDYVMGGLGMPLRDWVEANVVDDLTEGGHSMLRDAANALLGHPVVDPELLDKYIATSRSDKSKLRATVAELRRLTSLESQIDIASLLKDPHELFLAENEWAGASFKTQREMDVEEATLVRSDAVALLALAVESQRQAEVGSEGSSQVPLASTVADQPVTPSSRADIRTIVQHALAQGAESLVHLDDRMREGSITAEAAEGDAEDDDMKKARLNLIAIAKRAPIDRIARLPPELVPPHIRHIVPTLST